MPLTGQKTKRKRIKSSFHIDNTVIKRFEAILLIYELFKEIQARNCIFHVQQGSAKKRVFLFTDNNICHLHVAQTTALTYFET